MTFGPGYVSVLGSAARSCSSAETENKRRTGTNQENYWNREAVYFVFYIERREQSNAIHAPQISLNATPFTEFDFAHCRTFETLHC